jgi:alpha-methylacyl-CoA racemase
MTGGSDRGTDPHEGIKPDGIRPLDGIRVVELASVAPAPLCAMILADFGAEVIVVERPGGSATGLDLAGEQPLFRRGKQRVVADLKSDAGRELVTGLAAQADVLVEGYRPGVLERLGLGPDELLAVNRRLIYTRVTGWGQDGPYALRAGHDINYIAVAGALAQVGVNEPVPPGTFVGDYGGGTLNAVIGVLLALQARERTGAGQVVDAAMVDGAVTLLAGHLELHARGYLRRQGENPTDGLAPFYGSYRCSDGRWYSVGAIESRFYASLLAALGLTDIPVEQQMERSRWPQTRERIAAAFTTRTRDEWERVLAEADVCGAPVLRIDELAANEHVAARASVLPVEGGWEPAPAPRLSATPGRAGGRQPVGDAAAFRPR